ncbi:hypothetical protein PF002_g29195 [Phytophthora fragariae]|uniref:Uncharacterized protein n=1 Tax=Phytophthora fragariae TaxID=53985 RepID=A0A6A3IY22_9STRA|nr:hypothetical protein PF011_g20205 [Phytophthora fragariae]KAE9173910.1 hypothetical protein PF002_g29195 [Phytophthora fragariae]
MARRTVRIGCYHRYDALRLGMHGGVMVSSGRRGCCCTRAWVCEHNGAQQLGGRCLLWEGADRTSKTEVQSDC